MVALAIIVASSSSLVVVVAFVVSFVRGQYNRSRGGSRNTLHGYTEYGAPTLAPKDSCPITGYPAWPPVVSSLGVPTLTYGPDNGPWAQNRFNSCRYVRQEHYFLVFLHSIDPLQGILSQVVVLYQDLHEAHVLLPPRAVQTTVV